MRVKKTLHSGVYELGVVLSGTAEVDDVYTKYRYDGQMPIQTYVNKADSTTLETDQALGARGTDRVSLTNSSGTFISYPLYDAHGNEVATLAKSGSSYTTGHQRSYGAWGEVRQGDTTGGPRARYCGNLGHVQDDETGLIYMRARYYDVSSGRFISEDPGCDGLNWFAYAGNDPVGSADCNGKSADEIEQLFKAALGKGLISQELFNAFMDKSTGLREFAKRLAESLKMRGQRQLDAEQVEELLDDVKYEFAAKSKVVDMAEMTEDAASDADAFATDELILEVEYIDESGLEGGTI